MTRGGGAKSRPRVIGREICALARRPHRIFNTNIIQVRIKSVKSSRCITMTDFVRNSVAFPQRAHSAHVTTARNVAPATVTHRPASSLITADIICASERSAAGKNAITCHKNRAARNPASACNALAACRSPLAAPGNQDRHEI